LIFAGYMELRSPRTRGSNEDRRKNTGGTDGNWKVSRQRLVAQRSQAQFRVVRDWMQCAYEGGLIGDL